MAAVSVSTATARSCFSQGEPADAVFYIRKGRVKLTVVLEQVRKAVVAILGTEGFFGKAPALELYRDQNFRMVGFSNDCGQF
ncbi:MAG: cyclic nucleotide-binding domain-containing protein [Xanthobacteraceae bacterium]